VASALQIPLSAYLTGRLAGARQWLTGHSEIYQTTPVILPACADLLQSRRPLGTQEYRLRYNRRPSLSRSSRDPLPIISSTCLASSRLVPCRSLFRRPLRRSPSLPNENHATTYFPVPPATLRVALARIRRGGSVAGWGCGRVGSELDNSFLTNNSLLHQLPANLCNTL
jgi:hypothetical protein